MPRIVGIDLSADGTKTSACVVEISEDAIDIDVPDDAGTHGFDDPTIATRWLRDDNARIGIDAPFGWPSTFTEAVAAWSGDTRRWPEWDRARVKTKRSGGYWTEPAEFLAYRTTDRFVRLWRKDRHRSGNAGCIHRKWGWPGGLSVSTNMIGITAFRAARLLQAAGEDSRTGAGRLFEVYPAGALAEWCLPSSGYKRDADNRAALAGELCRRMCSGLRQNPLGAEGALAKLRPKAGTDKGGEVYLSMCGSDHILDAVVAAVTTWAAVNQQTFPWPGEPRSGGGEGQDEVRDFVEMERASRNALNEAAMAAHPVLDDISADVDAEGWIHHPRVTIERIVETSPNS